MLRRKYIFSIIFLFLLVTGIQISAHIYGEFLWFQYLNYSPVFWTMLLAKGLSALLFGMVFILMAGLNVYLARKIGPPKMDWELSYRTSDLNTIRVIPVKPAWVNKCLLGVCLVLGLVMGLWPATKWDSFLCFLYQTPFFRPDPLFYKDIGFYVFSYPVHVFLQKWLFYTLLLVTGLVGLIYIKDKALRLKFGNFMFTRQAKIHLSLLVGLFLMLIVWNERLKMLGLLYSSRGVVFGAGYTDMNAQLAAYWLILIMAATCAFLFWINISSQGWKWPLIGLTVLVAFSILASGIYPWVVQKFIVLPNELAKEKPYILKNIQYTRLGYDLDRIEERNFQVSTDLTPADIQKNLITIKNIKLWDKEPLKQTYREIQEMRLYYRFASVDEDRYILHGEKTQVMLSARELDLRRLPRSAQTFENRHLKYTHGYGLCMNPVNHVTEKGLPRLIIKDIPPVSQTTLDISRPEIYYGEVNNNFVMVNTKTKELDYPKGDINVYTRYEGRGGLPINSFFHRLIFSIKFAEPKILFTGYITPESRLMFHRQVEDRVRALAPFLSYDRDSYLAASDDGRLFWIQDAYTTSDQFPYSERLTLSPPDSNVSRQRQPVLFPDQRAGMKRINYIRNSVKVVIDAYHGTTTYYVVDEDDPIIRTYRKIFPGLFKPLAQMQPDLRSHIRYPRDLFEIQANIYQSYHMGDVQVFYNKEDLWDLPVQKSVSGSSRLPMKGYYLIMRLPDRKQEEFLLMVPFTPDKKSNMIAWMCALCDGPDYGKLLVYKFPKEKLIYGPRQVEARIDQQAEIARELTLWSQKGSDVMRGDLLVLPIEESVIYIEPVFLIADDRSSLPELKRVIVAYGEKIAMEPTLSEALQAIFGWGNTDFSSFTVRNNSDKNHLQWPSITDLARKANVFFQKALESHRQGDWCAYGQYQEQLQGVLDDLLETAERNHY